MQIKTFIEYYYRQIKIAFLILVSLTIVVNLLDIFFNVGNSKYLKLINIISIVPLLLTFLLHFRFRISLNICLTIALYTVVLNLFLSQLMTESPEDVLLLLLFRETIFLLLMLIFSGLFIHKYHAVIIFLFILFRYISLTIRLQSPFMGENLPVFLVTFSAIVVIVYFFSGRLHRSIRDLQIKQNEILQSNKELRVLSEELKTVNEDLSGMNGRLQDMNTAKDKFFSIISHDLKNPLNILNGFVDIMLYRGDQMDPEKRNLYLSKMKESVDGINSLVEDLLEWSRSQSGRITYAPQPFLIKELTDSVCYFLKQYADSKSIIFVCEIEENLRAYADFNMVFTVLRNLISNAIKFSYREREVMITAAIEDKQIRISVIDEGTGIKPEEKEKIFDMNTHFSSPGTDNEKGTGLGLILCMEFVEKNKGSLGVETVEGKGSTFWFTLPLNGEMEK